MKVSDVAICRSGASTLAELMYCQLPAVLVPFPHAAGNHQYYNAKILADGRCAIIAQDDKKLFQRLVTAFNQVSNPRRLSAMRYAYLRLNIPNELIEKLSEKNPRGCLCGTYPGVVFYKEFFNLSSPVRSCK